MTQDERNRISTSKIMESAIKEFALSGYDRGSVNAICTSGEISKGILYHYFATKDELYLACIRACFSALVSYLNENAPKDGDAESILDGYFTARSRFFRDNDAYRALFCQAVLTPPSHLKNEIREIREEFDELNTELMTSVLRNVELSEGMNTDDVIAVFRDYQDFMNARSGSSDFTVHEEKSRMALKILLYGVVRR
ncbi:MAG: TetR/AcrR family transcriptional regulator [Bullifex sp.]